MKYGLLFIAISCLLAACRPAGQVDITTLSAGTISFDIQLKAGSQVSPMMRTMLPTKGEYSFAGDSAALRASTALMSLNLLTNGKNRTMTLIMDNVLSGKVATQATEAELRPALDSSNIIAELTTDTKKILGIATTKIILRDTVTQATSVVYMAIDAPVGALYWQLPFGKIKGLVLAYEYKKDDLDLLCTATAITATPPAPALLQVPKGLAIERWKTAVTRHK